MTNEQMSMATFPFRPEPMVYRSEAIAAIEAATLEATLAERERCAVLATQLAEDAEYKSWFSQGKL